MEINDRQQTPKGCPPLPSYRKKRLRYITKSLRPDRKMMKKNAASSHKISHSF